MSVAQKNGFVSSTSLPARSRSAACPQGASNPALNGSEMAPQGLEKMESGLENGAGTQEPI
jgi:hypothetical protein